jgi:broad-specificity NMP kinase
MVTGAPGAGKTTTLNALLELKTEHVAFDVDRLAPVEDAHHVAVWLRHTG